MISNGLPRMLAIAGMPRSGTTFLQRVCDAHPQMVVSNELGHLRLLGRTYPTYASGVLGQWRQADGRWRFDGGWEPDQSRNHAANLRYVLDHLAIIGRTLPLRVGLEHQRRAAAAMYPGVRVVGDKLPKYIFEMGRLVAQPELLRVAIYRDCRDVTNSFLAKLRKDWHGDTWTRPFADAASIARRWVESIERTEEHADDLLTLRYEDIVEDPAGELGRLAEWIGVDPAGFDTGMASSASVGKHRTGLTDEQLEGVMSVAGPTLERLGYL